MGHLRLGDGKRVGVRCFSPKPSQRSIYMLVKEIESQKTEMKKPFEKKCIHIYLNSRNIFKKSVATGVYLHKASTSEIK